MKKLFKKTKKGFTLVELLVVIAILAVLASVSVIGYLGFVEKARNSDAVTELAQVRELLRAELIDGEDHQFTYKDKTSDESYNKSFKMKYVDGNYYLLDLSTTTNESGLTAPSDVSTLLDVTSAFTISNTLSDLNGLSATIKVKLESTTTNVGGNAYTASTCVDYKIVYANYERTAGGSANWDVAKDSIDTGLHA